MNLPVKDLKELISIDPPNGFDLWNALGNKVFFFTF